MHTSLIKPPTFFPAICQNANKIKSVCSRNKLRESWENPQWVAVSYLKNMMLFMMQTVGCQVSSQKAWVLRSTTSLNLLAVRKKFCTITSLFLKLGQPWQKHWGPCMKSPTKVLNDNIVLFWVLRNEPIPTALLWSRCRGAFSLPMFCRQKMTNLTK